MNELAKKQANLRLLQRSDPTVSDILGSATHVVLYNFQQTSQSWEKSNVEGSLFLANRQGGYVLLILNRNSPENYQLIVTKDFQLQNNDPYLIFKQQELGSTVIRGIWFPDAQERTSVHVMLSQVLDQLRLLPPIHPQVQQQAQPQMQQVPQVDAVAALGALLSPEALGSKLSSLTVDASARVTTDTPSPQRQHTPGNAPTLDKKSLQLALLSLIQDDRFLDLLHAQYLKVAHARAGKSTK